MLRVFGRRSFKARIVSWQPWCDGRAELANGTGPGTPSVALWRVHHEDGDVEDLEEHEVREALTLLEHSKALDAAPPERNAEENWELFCRAREDTKATERVRRGELVFQVGETVLAWDVHKARAGTPGQAVAASKTRARTPRPPPPVRRGMPCTPQTTCHLRQMTPLSRHTAPGGEGQVHLQRLQGGRHRRHCERLQPPRVLGAQPTLPACRRSRRVLRRRARRLTG